jgi:hypothetical protein
MTTTICRAPLIATLACRLKTALRWLVRAQWREEPNRRLVVAAGVRRPYTAGASYASCRSDSIFVGLVDLAGRGH